MNKNYSSLLALLFMVFLALPGASRAGASNDFMALQVPNVPQAVSFFQNLMNCDAIDQGVDHLSTSVLLDCGDGTMVELSKAPQPTHTGRQQAIVISFTTADAASTLRWLHSKGIVIAGRPLRVKQRGGLEKTVVNFVAPWGQMMQLVSYGSDHRPQLNDTPAIQLASP